MGLHRALRAQRQSQSDEAFSIKAGEVIAQVRARQERRGEFRAQTGRLFVFLGVLVAFFATLIPEMDGDLDALLLGLAILLAVIPLVLIHLAGGRRWHDLQLSRIDTSSSGAAKQSLIVEGERQRKKLDDDIRWANAHLVTAEIATAIIIFALIGVALAVVPGKEAPQAGSWNAIAADIVLALAVFLLRFWLAPPLMFIRDGIEPKVRKGLLRRLVGAPIPGSQRFFEKPARPTRTPG